MITKQPQPVTPHCVSEKMNFDVADPLWRYETCSTSMAAKQAEGVAGLWNLLADQRVALLADEVGMGKTYQAIAVMLLMWQEKPDARILVMAPNSTLCNNWKTEFTTFIHKHLRMKDNPFTSHKGKEKYAPQFHGRLKELSAAVKEKSHYFFLTTIYSLSGLVPKDEKDNAFFVAEKYGEIYRQEIKDALDGTGLDLIIIDEAHYFRNRNDSQRAAAARTFFGEGKDRLARNALLLTATPNHSAARNIYDILSYFTDITLKYGMDDVRSLMENFAIRRLRKMCGSNNQHYSKYAYRREQASAASFSGSAEAELFFAFYQKKLVEELDKENKGSGDKRMMYGYLEGFESTGNIENEQDANDNEHTQTDFSRALDSSLLTGLTRQFHNVYHRFPDHPKYDVLVNECMSDDPFASQALYSRKHLVFVRRIPSVREITQRINARYDEMMAERLIRLWQLPPEALEKWRSTRWSREEYENLISEKTINYQDTDEPAEECLLDDDGEENEAKLSSRIAALFVTKTSGILRRTDCSNVSLRFRRPESLLSLFLEPARDGISATYTQYYRRESGERMRDSYSDAARDIRQEMLVENVSNYAHPMATAWGIMFDLLPEQHQHQIRTWKAQPNGMAIVENFANYLRIGYLFASPVMVELYCWFTEFNRVSQRGDAQQRYLQFIEWVTPKFKDSLILRYFSAAIQTFETLCEKIVGQPLDNSLYAWRELSSLNSPAWYASGESHNRERLIRGFNSPFFPDVLVATSVMQEGVNLHLQCHKVHHYGIAWTPGDNEQRNGRVDRLFGRVNMLLKESSNAEMIINYPYLASSFDQDQLASFIHHKYVVEEKLDNCETQSFDREIDTKENTSGWHRWLREPVRDREVEDPYPAKFGHQ
ncbi:DEAD/DEAH box helicase [Citrobacter braakii]|uniref:DEAD/DEAH box helicase n=2 Tax=Klebsiella TaxID=570 RepID=A0AAX3CMU2_9ENTR|nr:MULTISPECIES: DEAD/DEAH box helicase [Enterobacterales]ELS5402616.1 DEAD/DEAH box helicase family protein [Raoultella ornithinolytica]MCE9947465.1 DEAD/DEAH box helicase [Hafnia paralvei]MDV0336986.1 DEAD/DEAH box helicase [Klebsiella grimontii]MDV0391210.1 DEAD/DEAH box helicase [Klebsiella grimontii]MDV0412144.1 DEAD/DEAH box helicase [Klebsiella grimontii]